MTERTTGLVLRVHQLSDTSLIVRWLTRDFGRLSTAAKGARRPNSPFRGKLDLFYLAEFTFARSRRSDLHTLREMRLEENFELLRRDLGCLRKAAYLARLVEQVTETESPVPGVFDLVCGFLRVLPSGASGVVLLAAELKLLGELGLAPDLPQTRLTAPAAQLAGALAQRPWTEIELLAVDPVLVKELSAFLHGFLIYHLGKIPPDRAEALAH